MYKILIFVLLVIQALFCETTYRYDDASSLAIDKFVPNSHIKVYIPSFPYLYLSKLINGTLVRSDDNNLGWDFMLAKSLKRDDLTYTFELREGIKFQDGSEFDADSVLENFNHFLKHSRLYKVLRKRFKSIEKISKYKVKFTFKEPYELFMDRLTRINIYSHEYIKKFGWGINTIYTAVNTHEPGNYGLGPYVLQEGVASGRKQTSIIKLKANPYYYEKGMPYIDKITIYTDLSTDDVLSFALKQEGKLDISPIPFNKKVETILSPYSKLVTSTSKHNISVLFNMLKQNSPLKDKKIRVALNQAIDQEKLLKFVYKGEGSVSSSTINNNLYSVKMATKYLKTHRKRLLDLNASFANEHLKSILNGVVLNVYTMDRYLFLWKGIEFQLSKYGVKLNYKITSSAKDIFSNLFENINSPKDWDVLTMGNDSWSSNNPWSMFFHYRSGNIWSALNNDVKMNSYLEDYSKYRFNSPEFIKQVQKIIFRAYNEAYVLAVPAPNIVLAVNKEVDYTPSKVLLMPLWKVRITPYHWSIREGSYPKSRELFVYPRKIL